MFVPHGRLLGVLGRPRAAGDIVFCPALVEIDEPIECNPLAVYHRPAMLAFGEFQLDGDAPPDALWVRSRLSGLFGYRPLQIADGRENLLDAGFVTAMPDEVHGWTAHPFAVIDDACAWTRLVLSCRESAALGGRIAREFWGLLAHAGDGEDFRAEGLGWDAEFEYGQAFEARSEVGRLRGVYYAGSLQYDEWFDPDRGRPDYSGHRYRGVSRPVRVVRPVG